MYVVETRSGQRTLVDTPQANGNAGLTHILDGGVRGRFRGFSGDVDGVVVTYLVDLGPSRGIERSAT